MPNESHPFPDEIHIEQLDVFTRVGVPEEERAKPQKLNYSAVAEETKNFVRDQYVSLIETLAERLASHLLKSFPIQKVTIELRKFALQDAKYVSVTVTRTACVG